MKKELKAIISLGVCLIFLLCGCNDLVELGKAERDVTVILSTGNGERTAYPNKIEKYDFDYIQLEFSKEGSNVVTVRMDSETTTYTTALAQGTWTVSAKGFITIGAKVYEAANGSSSIVVAASNVTVAVNLHTGIFEGKPGVFSHNISWAGLTVTGASLQLDSYPAGASVKTVSLVGAQTGSFELSPGYYLLNVAAANSGNSTAASWSELVHIYSGHETSVIHSFVSADFIGAVPLRGSASITGTYKIGETLSLNTAALLQITGGAFSYQWKADGANISGATGTSYTILGADVGKVVTCVITNNKAVGNITATGSKIPYTVSLNVTGKAAADVLTASSAVGNIGDVITLNYTVANDKVKNKLDFSGTSASIANVDGVGTGTRSYTISAADAAAGIITINAVFSHTDLTPDVIAFANTSNESKTYGDGVFTKAITNTGAGTGAISYAPSDSSVATVNASGAVTIHKAGTATITATKAADINYAQATASYTLTVAKKPVTITGATAADKIYNGDTIAAPGGTLAVSGKVGSDDVTVVAGTASFANKTAATGKTVTFAGYSLGGAAKDNYTLSAQPASVTANIAALQLTTTANSTTLTRSRAYDGTTTAAVTAAGTLANKVTNDTVTLTVSSANYNSANVGEAVNITVVYAISGADAGNYIKPVDYVATTNVAITKATGRTVTVPASSSITTTGITVGAVTVATPNYGQTAEYAISISTTPGTWQDSAAFTGLTSGTNYYVFARSKENANCSAGAVQTSAVIRTLPSSGGGFDNITIINDIDQHEFGFTNPTEPHIPWTESLTVTVSGTYSSYMWIVNNDPHSNTTNSLTINCVDYPDGKNEIMVIVVKDGVPYSQRIYFWVE